MLVKRSTSRALLLAVALVSIGAQPVAGQQPSVKRLDNSTITAAEIDATVTRLMRGAEVTGVGIAIFNNNRIVYLKAYGVRDKEKNLPLTPDSVMTSASLSKSAFASMVVQLVEESVLDWDKPVYQYLPKPLPEYPFYRDLASDPRCKQITLRMLLDHTSGFPNWRSFNDDHKLNFNFTPGSRFAYSGEGILLAQLVVETVTKKPINDVMRQHLFVPDDMTRTSMVWESRFESDYANGYDEYGRSLGPERRTTADAAGSMQTTLRDYANFLQAFLQGRNMKTATREQMLSPQIEILSKHEFPSLATETTTENQSIRLGYGLGWGLYWTPYGRAFFKEGHDEGWRHYAVCFDKPGSGILIMTNSSNGEGIYKEPLETLLKNTYTPIEWEQFTPYNQLPPRPPLRQHKEVAVDPKVLEKLVGRYQFNPDTMLTLPGKAPGSLCRRMPSLGRSWGRKAISNFSPRSLMTNTFSNSTVKGM
jgi:CubicO group peptidase (beta-lactamase class C family)